MVAVRSVKMGYVRSNQNSFVGFQQELFAVDLHDAPSLFGLQPVVEWISFWSADRFLAPVISDALESQRKVKGGKRKIDRHKGTSLSENVSESYMIEFNILYFSLSTLFIMECSRKGIVDFRGQQPGGHVCMSI